MSDTPSTHPFRALIRLAAAAATLGAGFALAACGSPAGRAATLSTSETSHGVASAGYTVKVASVAGLGKVLANGDGRTLYLLTSEKGGKVTCTAANGCTQVWPAVELPEGVSHGIAGSGVAASMLQTAQAPGGRLYLTYGPSHWPLYTYAGDSGPGQARGQGIVSFGGTWWALTAAGKPITAGMSSGGGRYAY